MKEDYLTFVLLFKLLSFSPFYAIDST